MRNTRLINFNNGEGLDHNDLNDLHTRLGYKYGDGMHYPHVIDLMGVSNGIFGTPTYDTVYNTPTNFLGKATFFIGSVGGYPTATGLSTSLKGGTIAIYNASVAPVVTGENFLFFQLEDGDAPFTLATNFGGAGVRYDALVITGMTVVTDDSQTRDFKDATTGALTTTSVSKGRRINPVFAIIQGTSGGPRPTIPAGNHVVCYYYVNTSDVVFPEDCMFPLHGQVHQLVLNNHIWQGDLNSGVTNATTGLEIVTSTGSKSLKFVIPLGGPFRVMGMYIDYGTWTTIAGVHMAAYSWRFSTEYSSDSRVGSYTADMTAQGTAGSMNWIFDPVNPAAFTPSINDIIKPPMWSGVTGFRTARTQAALEGVNTAAHGIRMTVPTSGDTIHTLSMTLLKY